MTDDEIRERLTAALIRGDWVADDDPEQARLMVGDVWHVVREFAAMHLRAAADGADEMGIVWDWQLRDRAATLRAALDGTR